MVRNFDHKFPLNSGVTAYVQSADQRSEAYKIRRWIENRWSAPPHFYHFRSGGHVEAARIHQQSPFIMRMDLRRFFDQVTRSKVHRALRRIGYSNRDAYEFACEGTVMKDGLPKSYSVPFGFVQSMHLASLALHFSALGREMLTVQKCGTRMSLYVDDVLLSADDRELLMTAKRKLLEAAEKAGFEFNAAKERGPAPAVEAFNIRIGQGGLQVADGRMAEFRRTVRTSPDATAIAIIAYVRTINPDQAKQLSALRPRPMLRRPGFKMVY